MRNRFREGRVSSNILIELNEELDEALKCRDVEGLEWREDALEAVPNGFPVRPIAAASTSSISPCPSEYVCPSVRITADLWGDESTRTRLVEHRSSGPGAPFIDVDGSSVEGVFDDCASSPDDLALIIELRAVGDEKIQEALVYRPLA